MQSRSHYLALKPIFDIILFGFNDVERYLSQAERVKFYTALVPYPAVGFSEDDSLTQDILHSCSFYFSISDEANRKDLVKVIQDHPGYVELVVRKMIGKYHSLDYTTANNTFEKGLALFIKENMAKEYILLFFVKYFSKLRQINPEDYHDKEVSFSEYSALISEYIEL